MLLAAGIGAIAFAVAGCSLTSTTDTRPNTQTGSSETSASAETTGLPKAGVVTPPKSKAYIGIFRPRAPFDITKLDDYSEISDKYPAILMWFQPWAPGTANQFDTAAVTSTLRRGVVPMITWEPWNPGTDSNLVEDPGVQPEYRLEKIINGDFDDYIREWARAVATIGGPVMLRPMHEMNGDWYPWGGVTNGNTPEQFVTAWRHVHDIFEEEGATNVTWVWSVNCESWPQESGNTYEAYYPGDDYVDWVGISGFNWGTSREDMSWRTFSEIYDEPLSRLDSLGKPIALTEFGSVEEPGDKAAWLTDAYEQIAKRPEIKAVVYYDNAEQGLKGEQDWNIDSSSESEQAYREAVADDHFVGAPARTLSEWAQQMTTEDWVFLKGFEPLY